jgi:hypothetical protein
MKLDNSNGRYIIIIAGILVISVVFVSLAFASEGWNLSVFTFDNSLQNRDYQINSNGNNMKKDHEIPLGVGLLPIAEKCVKRNIDTANEGWIYLFDNTIPDSVPLYLTDLSTWSVSFISFGGYEFTDGYIDVYQNKYGETSKFVGTLDMQILPENIDTMTGAELLASTIDLTGIDVVAEANYILYTVTFTLSTDGPLQFNSNYLPELVAPSACTLVDGDDCGVCWPCGPCQDDDLDKEVKLKFFFNWEGCPNPDQDFQIILTYKCMFLESPIPD